MKTPLLFICTSFFFLPLITIAQSDTTATKQPHSGRWSISLSGGYGWPGVKGILGSSSNLDTLHNYTSGPIRGTLGSGIFNSVVVSYGARKTIGIEAGAFASWGKNTLTGYAFSEFSSQTNEEYMRVNSKGILLGVYASDTFSKFRMSAHCDFVWGLSTQLFHHSLANSPVFTYDVKWKYYGGMSYGFMGKATTSYCVTDQFEVGVEGFFLLHSWAPEKGVMQSNSYNGQNMIYSYTNEQRNIDFVDRYTVNTVTGGSGQERPGVVYPLHAAGGNIILRYSF